MQSSKPRPPRNFLGRSISGCRQTGQQCVRRQLLSAKAFQVNLLIVPWLRTMTRLKKLMKSVLRHVPTKMSRTRIDLPGYLRPWSVSAKSNNCFTTGLKKSGKPEHHKQYKEAQKSFQNELKKARWQYIDNILCSSLDEGNHKPFWKHIRS